MSLMNLRPRGGPAFRLTDLFKGGQQGLLWLPESHRAALAGTAGATPTLFQDSVGASAVSAIEQPVGRVIDQSGRGNHAAQSTSAARPALTARVNLLSTSVSIESWPSIIGDVIVSHEPSVPDSDGGADTRKVFLNSSGYSFVREVLHSLPTSTGYSASVRFKKGNWRYIGLRVFSLMHIAIDMDLMQAVYIPSDAVTSVAVTPMQDGWVEVDVLLAPPYTGTPVFSVAISDQYGGEVSNAAGAFFFVHAPMLSFGSVSRSYQRVVTAIDYDWQAGRLALNFDGLDDTIGASFAAGTLPANADVYYVMRRTSAQAALAIDVTAGGRVFGITGPTGDTSAAFVGCGSPSATVNGVTVAGGSTAITRGQLLTATPSNTDLILEVRGANLSAWAQWATVSTQWSAYAFAGQQRAVLICPAQPDANRARIRRRLAQIFGIGGVV